MRVEISGACRLEMQSFYLGYCIHYGLNNGHVNLVITDFTIHINVRLTVGIFLLSGIAQALNQYPFIPLNEPHVLFRVETLGIRRN